MRSNWGNLRIFKQYYNKINGNFMKKWIIDRACERSTWLGLTTLLTGAGVALKPELAEAIISLGMALGGFVAVITADKKAV